MDSNENRAEELIKKYGLTPKIENRDQLKKLLEFEIKNYSGGSSEYIRVLCGMLFFIGNIEDSMLIFRAKMINMDVGSMVDIDFLFGAGVKKTLDFIERHQKNKDCKRMKDFIGDYDIEEYFDRREVVEEYINYYTGYFSL